jgi:hypothetical protein
MAHPSSWRWTELANVILEQFRNVCAATLRNQIYLPTQQITVVLKTISIM